MFELFFRTQKIFFFGLEKKVGYSFDVKLYDLSIYEHFRAIPGLLTDLRSYYLREKKVIIRLWNAVQCALGFAWNLRQKENLREQILLSEHQNALSRSSGRVVGPSAA